MKAENIFVRDIDWEVSLVLSSKLMSSLNEALVTVHLGSKEGHTKTIELNREELDRLRVKIAGLKKEMEDYSEDK